MVGTLKGASRDKAALYCSPAGAFLIEYHLFSCASATGKRPHPGACFPGRKHNLGPRQRAAGRRCTFWWLSFAVRAALQTRESPCAVPFAKCELLASPSGPSAATPFARSIVPTAGHTCAPVGTLGFASPRA